MLLHHRRVRCAVTVLLQLQNIGYQNQHNYNLNKICGFVSLFHNLFDKNDIKLEQKIVNDGNSCGKC